MPPDPWAIRFPNIRAAILPDPGFTLVEGDLARADAQVCAWDANCPTLKRLFRSGADIHSDNARWLYDLPNDIDPRDPHINGTSYRDNAKRGVHLVDYAGGPRTLASSLAVGEAKAEEFIDRWINKLHPEIGRWHRRILFQLRSGPPIVHNAFGFRKFYNDRITEYLLPQALAWICQSTVAIVTNKVLLYAYHRFAKRNPDIRLLLQIHDSLLFQVRTELLDTYIPLISMAFESVVVPYEDPLIIPHELKASSLNWGSMHEWPAKSPTSSQIIAAA